ncbi:MAG: spermidine synthase [Deltaproteobacteria bacterium]|nr:spermidine synthase [Deltaproteobacteria bacterium]
MSSTTQTEGNSWTLMPWAEARLFLISFLILFFQLVCIRWVPSYVRYLSYFSNFILMACFLGMGIGLLSSGRKWRLLPLFAPILLLFIVVISFVKFELAIETGEALYFRSTEVKAEQAESYLLLPFVFGFVTILFIVLCQEMGRLFDSFKPLKAYAINIGGSMVGIAAFFAISLARIGPLWWFLIASVGVVLLLHGSTIRKLSAVIVLGTVCLLAAHLGANDIWSPYYKISMNDLNDGGKVLNVNNIGHQTMQVPEHKEGFYNTPYNSFKDNHFERALIIGAGSGTDCSFALKYGVQSITAVEIDPVIYKLGKENHPSVPYSHPRVKMHINDARAFLKNDTNKYDLIIYALPDSLTLTSSFSSLRLESYLFTTESFRETRDHLAPGGLLVLYNYYREDWLIEKISGMLEQTFGEPPAVQVYGGWGKAAVFMIGEKLADLKRPIPRKSGNPDIKPATDDWPFLYMTAPAIPTVFLKALGMIALFTIVLVFLASPKGTLRRLSPHFFFLGAAFMLLETTSIVKFSLLFGSTWMVNSLVFFAVLGMVMLAIWVSYKYRIEKLWVLYVALFGVLLLNYVIPLEILAGSNPVVRYLLSSLLLFSPIFLANLIFTQTFREEEGVAAVALASNIIGSLLGGMCEYSSLLIGYKNLVIIVAVFYAASFIFLNLARKRARAS